MSSELKLFRELLIESIMSSSKVFIVGHNEPDFDAIGSAVGLQTLAKNLGKDAYIIVNDSTTTLESGVKKIVENYGEEFNIITLEEFRKLKDDNSILITTDVNKDYLVSVKDDLESFKRIHLIDHHAVDAHTIKADASYVKSDVSSASEIVAGILLLEKNKFPKSVASFLLAGIILDTKRFKQNTSSRTHDIAEKLLNRGADPDYVNSLFLEEFETYCKINNLIVNGSIFKKYREETLVPSQISFTINREAPTTIYRKDEVAKAADAMLKFVDASFTMGYTKDGNITISARSIKKPKESVDLIQQIDVGEILTELDENHCGGNTASAGGLITLTQEGFTSIFEIEKRLMEIVEDKLNSKAELQEIPQAKQYVRVEKKQKKS